MVLRMANPTKNKYGVYMYTVRVPTDLVEVVGKRVYSISLQTKDPNEARERFKAVSAEKDREHKALRSPPEAIPLKQLVYLAGKAYREFVHNLANEPGDTDHWTTFQATLTRMEREGQEAKVAWYGPTADKLLCEDGLNADEYSRARLIDELHKVYLLAGEQLHRRADGDYSPDQNEHRFPLAPLTESTTSMVQVAVSVTSLLALWEREHRANGRAEKTVADYRNIVKIFTEHIGHDDASKVTRGMIKNFCDHLVHEKGLSAKTVNGRYLTCLKALFRVGYERELIDHNPAAAVQQKVVKKPQSRPPGFTDAEAKLILALADRAMQPPADGSRDRRSMHNKRVARWVPWVLCYTGARVAEITQLRREDVQEVDGIPFIRITPEAGSVKTGQYRDVPLHPHLVELGFLDFARASAEGPLFYEAKPETKRRGKGITQPQWAGNELGRWLKTELGEAWPDVQPNHAWRHRFKTQGRLHGIGSEFIDAVQGHSNKTVAASYGEMPLQALYREIKKLPKVVVG